MNAKQVLYQLREADYEISILENARAAAWAQATRVTAIPAQSGIRAEVDPHRFDDLVILDDVLAGKINALAAAKAAAVQLIYSLENPRHREVLAAYFIDNRTKTGGRKTWEAVADELYISFSGVMQTYRNALTALERRPTAPKELPPA